MVERSSGKSAFNPPLFGSTLSPSKLGNVAVFPAAAHMSLAIEALRQVHAAEDAEIHNVTLRDVNIKTALIIPEADDGMEIQFRFQEAATAEKTNKWYSFAVESITDERWTVHCEGKIAANHNAPTSTRELESPVDLSRLTQRVPGKRWYDAFKRVGFEYGPTFQPLTQIRTNGKNHEATANVEVAVESGVMDGESRYILHPSTIDACLQLIIISINAGRHKEMTCGVVPLQMEEVSLWFPNEKTDPNGHAVAWTDGLDGRYFNTHTKLATDSGELVLDVKNMRCVSFEAAVPQNATQAPDREPYMEIVWKPDVTTLDSPHALPLHHGGQSEIDEVEKIVELIDHKRAINRVLLLGESLIELVGSLRGYLSSTTTYTIGSLSAEALETSHVPTIDDRVSLVSLSDDLSEWNETINEKYSLIILGEHMLQAKGQLVLLSTIRPFIAEGGSLISFMEPGSEQDFTKDLKSTGYSDIGFQFHLSNKSVVYSQLPDSESSVQESDERIQILTMDPHRPSLQVLAKSLRARGSNVSIETLSKVEISQTSKIIIDDTEGIIMASLRADDVFETLQKILCSNSSIAWLTTGINQGKDILGGMSQGFLRAIRSEQVAARITLLDVDFDEDPERVAEILYEKLANVATKSSGKDTEFWLHQGMVHVARIRPNDTLNGRLSATLTDAAQESVLPAMETFDGKVATNGELSFCPRIREDQELSESEVEIQVQASEFPADDSVQPGNKTLPRIILGKILRAGHSIDATMINQTAAVYTTELYSTVIRTTDPVPIDAIGFETMTRMAATLPNLCRAMNCLEAGSVDGPGKHALVLPSAPHPSLVGTIVDLGHALRLKVTIVVETASDREECIRKYGVPSESTILSEDVGSIRGLMSGASGTIAPSAVIASDFSALSQEVWRLMPSMGRFILSDGSVGANPDALPFSKGASFITTDISAVYKQGRASTVLKSALDVLSVHGQLLVKEPTVYDISALKTLEGISNRSTRMDNSIVVYNYGESSVKVCSHL